MNRLTPDTADARFLRRAILLLLLLGLTVALYRALDLLILGFGSMLGAITIHAIADLYDEKLHLPRRACVPAGMFTVLFAIAFLVWLVAWQFGEQVNQLVVALPGLLEQFETTLSQSPVGAKIVAAVEAAFAGSRIAQDIGGLVSGSGEMVLNFILLIVGAIFLSSEPDLYKRGFLLLIPKSKRPAFADALNDASDTLRLWLRAQLICMTSMGVLVGIGLWISGVPSAAALGLLAGLSEFIPYVGPTAAMLPALGLAATQGTGPLVGSLVTYAVVRLVQTNFITPFVQARVVAIPPAVTLFAIVGIGVVFGIFGLFFSAALLVVLYTLIRSLYLRETLGEEV
ncbi:AI-2E family transporter [Stakelama sp. CBK3Z-3]|uniref:AI-2E family transporter n=1 Tax=Stakelama flava TaxID=2860338 RepID=A0ABS6XMN5_9SPHN|nr:AI-2E family transporter [Stakelama flava]MBW4331473.1 AI-2E family transporter [Stakelama flava]